MIAEVLVGVVGVVGIGGGLSALMFWKKNGKAHQPNPWRYAPEVLEKLGPPQQQASAPVQVQWPPELAALLTHITERLETAIERVEHPMVVREPAGTPEWATTLHQDLASINDRMSEPATLPVELTAGLGLITDRLEALMQMPQPDFEPVVARLEELVASMPEPDQRPELEAELVRQLAELPQRVGRSVSDAVATERKNNPPPKNLAPPERKNNPPQGPPKSAPRNFALNPNEQPNTPSIPAPYVPGTIEVPAGQVWSLLYLIQKQLSPNCPGSSASFTISAEGTVYVGGASQIGGKLSEDNYAYKLEDGDPPVRYRSTYPGGNTPVGEIQVLSTGGGKLHVEVQS